MTAPVAVQYTELDLDRIAEAQGHVVVVVGSDRALGQAGRRVNRLTKGALERAIASEAFGKMDKGEVMTLAFPLGIAADAVHVVRLDKDCAPTEARAAGAALALVKKGKPMLILATGRGWPGEIGFGLALRTYRFDARKSKPSTEIEGPVTVMVSKPEVVEQTAKRHAALVEGVFFTRDLVKEPANVLTTTEFADRLVALREIGVEVDVLDEPELEQLGMRLLLSVGQGSVTPSKVVAMHWNGGSADVAPLVLVGKGVVFDTGGISLKPGAGMEEMTMDMGGAGTVAGVMKALALRKAQANVIGIVGLVENMPSGNATRPGDVVASMKGDTVEIINTDAEGRLVLADLLWYAQETWKPAAMIDLATLTGAIIIGLGNEKAGVFSNSDAFAKDFLNAAGAETEGAWHMPLDPAYDKMLKSDIADMKNIGGRPAGSITAAQFLKRFVEDKTPWIHLDIAGVASVSSGTTYAPKGATGWGVLSLDRLIRDKYEA